MIERVFMKQYFTGFFTALILSVSTYLFFGNKSKLNFTMNKPITIEDDRGKIIITSESIRIFNKAKGEVVFLGSSSRNSGSIEIKNDKGYNVANIGAWYGDGYSGNGSIIVNNDYGSYGWSVIGKVSEMHYQ